MQAAPLLRCRPGKVYSSRSGNYTALPGSSNEFRTKFGRVPLQMLRFAREERRKQLRHELDFFQKLVSSHFETVTRLNQTWREGGGLDTTTLYHPRAHLREGESQREREKAYHTPMSERTNGSKSFAVCRMVKGGLNK